MAKHLSGLDVNVRVRRAHPRCEFSGIGWIGRAPRPATGNFGDVVDYGPVVAARIFVGLEKGVDTGGCRTVPKAVDVADVDRLFLLLRGRQVGPGNVGATRAFADGWYQGGPEHSVVYEVIRTEEAESETEFFRRMDDIAEHLAIYFCQKEVIVVQKRGGTEWTRSAKFEG